MVKLTLRQKDGTNKEFTQDFIPFRKKFDYTKKEKEILEIENASEQQAELIDYQIKFVADLFDDKEVTVDAILDGISCDGSNVIAEIIFYDIMGFPRIDEEDGEDPKEQSAG